MKVYLFFIEEVYDFDYINQDVQVFAKKEDARKVFNEIVNEEKEWLKDEEDWIVDEYEDFFECYEEGYYSQYHTTARITEKEVK